MTIPSDDEIEAAWGTNRSPPEEAEKKLYRLMSEVTAVLMKRQETWKAGYFAGYRAGYRAARKRRTEAAGDRGSR